MTFQEFATSIRSDPFGPDDNTNPPLVVQENELSKAARVWMEGSTYNRRPYVVFEHTDEFPVIPLHGGSDVIQVGLDVTVRQEQGDTGELQDIAGIDEVFRLLTYAHQFVNEDSDGRNMVANSFQRVSRVKPHPSEGEGRHYIAYLRFAWDIHQ